MVDLLKAAGPLAGVFARVAQCTMGGIFPALDPLPSVDWITNRFGLFHQRTSCLPEV
jgi:hypothetical protein